MSTGRFSLTIVVIVTLAIALSGCTLQIVPPSLEMIVEPAYSSPNVLIPFELRGDGSDITARWTLRRYQGSDVWEEVSSWHMRFFEDSSGIVQVRGTYDGDTHLDDAMYELAVELRTNRGLSYPTVLVSSSRTEFYVDTQPPSGDIELYDIWGGGPDPLPNYDPAEPLEVEPRYTGTPDPEFESPVELYHRVDSTVPPTDDQDPTGDTILMWEGGEPSYNRLLTIIAIDQAGNIGIGSYCVETYRAP